MPLSGNERSRRYREKLKLTNPEKVEEQRKKNAERTRAKKRKIADMSEEEKNLMRKNWRDAKRKKKKKCRPITIEEHEEVNVKTEEAENYHEDEFDKDDDPLSSVETEQESSREQESPPPKQQKKTIPQTEFTQASSSKMGPEHRISKLDYDENPSHENCEDQFDIFGKNVAAKLRDIACSDNTQRLIAEKIVNDALFLAEMGQLNLAHSKILHSELI